MSLVDSWLCSAPVVHLLSPQHHRDRQWPFALCAAIMLRVHVKGANNLQAADRGGTSDPYCKVTYHGEKNVCCHKFMAISIVSAM